MAVAGRHGGQTMVKKNRQQAKEKQAMAVTVTVRHGGVRVGQEDRRQGLGPAPPSHSVLVVIILLCHHCVSPYL